MREKNSTGSARSCQWENDELDGAVRAPYTARMKLLLALLLSASPAFPAELHSLTVRVSKGKKTYTHRETTPLGKQANWVDRNAQRNMIVNTVVSRDAAGYLLQYQIEVSKPEFNTGTFQAQGSVYLQAGARVAAVECGQWTVDLGLDADRAPAPPAWSAGGPNHRVTGFIGKRRCAIVTQAGAQSNVVDGAKIDGRRSGIIFNAVLAAPVGSSCKVQYQVEDIPTQMQGEAPLTLGVKAVVNDKLALLVEGPAGRAAAAPRAEAPKEAGAVPLLR
jgi:hypothetical protein